MPKAAHKVVVIGHRNPDTDSICSAIAYAELKNKTSDLVCEPRRAGKMNQETEFVLKKFGVKPPRMCTDVNPKIRDVDYREMPGIPGSTSLRKAWEIMRDQKIDTLPITSAENDLEGIITVKDIATANMDIFDTGVLAKSLAEPLGYGGFGLHLFLTTLLSGFIFTLILYIGFKSYKVKADNPLKWSEIPKFNKEQLCTIIAIIVMVICCIGFKLDTGLFAFVAASVLILLGCADEKKAIKSIPWGTLVFICGVGALINVIKKLGGIDLISNFLTGLMTERTATPILAATSGILSWVSSTTATMIVADKKVTQNFRSRGQRSGRKYPSGTKRKIFPSKFLRAARTK